MIVRNQDESGTDAGIWWLGLYDRSLKESPSIVPSRDEHVKSGPATSTKLSHTCHVVSFAGLMTYSYVLLIRRIKESRKINRSIPETHRWCYHAHPSTTHGILFVILEAVILNVDDSSDEAERDAHLQVQLARDCMEAMSTLTCHYETRISLVLRYLHNPAGLLPLRQTLL